MCVFSFYKGLDGRPAIILKLFGKYQLLFVCVSTKAFDGTVKAVFQIKR